MSFLPANRGSGCKYRDKTGRLLEQAGAGARPTFSDRSKRAIPPIMVRRSKHDINRCRRMMRENALKQALAPAGAGFSGIYPRS